VLQMVAQPAMARAAPAAAAQAIMMADQARVLEVAVTVSNGMRLTAPEEEVA
jgi:hypothetical protein